MDWLGYLAAGGFGGGIVQVFRVVLDWRRGLRADERAETTIHQQASSDRRHGIEAFADDLQAQLDKERQRLDRMQQELDELRRKHATVREYAAQLRQDIIDRRPPPPRDWPAGI